MKRILQALIFAYLLLFPLGQLTQGSIQLIEVPLHATDVVVGMVAGIVVLSTIFRRKEQFISPFCNQVNLFLVFAFLSLILATPLLSGGEVEVALLYLGRWIAYVLFFWAAATLAQEIGFRRNLITGLFLAGSATAGLGMLQYIVYPDLRPLTVYEWDPHYYRVVGTFLDPGFTGLILVLFLLLGFMLLWRGKGKTWTNLNTLSPKTSPNLLILGGLLSFLALGFTYSRSSYLALLTGAGVISWVKRAPKFFLAVVLALALTWAVLPRQAGGEGVRLERVSTIEARLTNWKNTATIFRDNWLTGVGFNAYRYAQERYGFADEKKLAVSHAGAGADSSLLFVAATTGIFGLGAYLWLLWTMARAAWRRRSSPMGLVALASLGAVLIHSLFLNSLFYPWVMGWLWLLFATLPTKSVA